MAFQSNSLPSSYKVLNHGDLWVNNFMFKYEEEKPVDVIFVDFQMSFYSSPGIDINYFICTSPKTAIRLKNRTKILEHYHKSFASTLKQLNYNQRTITFDDALKEISTREFYGFTSAIGILPLLMMNKEASKNSNIENLADENASEKIRQLIYNEPNYVEAMQALTKYFDDNKVFDRVLAN